MTKHTPGPWDVSESGSIGFEDGYLGEAYDFNATTETDLPMMANARLMAAAPDLLEFVEAVCPILDEIGKRLIYAEETSSTMLEAAKTGKQLMQKVAGENWDEFNHDRTRNLIAYGPIMYRILKDITNGKEKAITDARHFLYSMDRLINEPKE